MCPIPVSVKAGIGTDNWYHYSPILTNYQSKKNFFFLKHIPLNVWVDSLQPFVVIFPFFEEGFNVDLCVTSANQMSVSRNFSPEHSGLMQVPYHRVQRGIYWGRTASCSFCLLSTRHLQDSVTEEHNRTTWTQHQVKWWECDCSALTGYPFL